MTHFLVYHLWCEKYVDLGKDVWVDVIVFRSSLGTCMVHVENSGFFLFFGAFQGEITVGLAWWVGVKCHYLFLHVFQESFKFFIRLMRISGNFCRKLHQRSISCSNTQRLPGG